MAEGEELKPVYVELHKAFKAEDYEGASKACDKILKKSPGDKEVQQTRVLAAVYAEKWEEALKGPVIEGQEYERAYVLYRRSNNCEDALTLLNQIKDPTIPVQHLKAQVLYKLGHFAEAADIYAQIHASDDDAEGNPEFMTNLYGSFVAAGKGKEALAKYGVDEGLMERFHELASNTGAAMVQAGNLGAAEQRLKEALGICNRMGKEEGFSSARMLEETSPINLELAYILARRGKRAEAFEQLTPLINKASKLSDPVVKLLAFNNAAALRGDKDLVGSAKKIKNALPDAEPKLLPYQSTALAINRALIALKTNKEEEAVEILETLKSKSDAAQAWKVNLLEIIIKATKDSTYQVESDLKVLFKNVKGNFKEGEREVGTALTQVLVNQGHIKEAAELLESITSLQGYPGHVATLASLYSKLGQQEAVLQAFDQAIQASEGGKIPAEARVKLLQGAAKVRSMFGQHPQAAEALQQMLQEGEIEGDERLRALAALVIATSWYNVEETETLSEGLPVSASEIFDKETAANPPIPSPYVITYLSTLYQQLSELVPEDLEDAGLPRTSRASRAALLGDKATAGGAKERKRKVDPEKQRRKREKARLQYIEKLIAQGKYDPKRPPPPPDPERWIAKAQRSYNKRGRKARNKFVGAQGSGDGAQKDAVRLDVAQRVAAQKKKDAEEPKEEKKVPPAGRRKKR